MEQILKYILRYKKRIIRALTIVLFLFILLIVAGAVYVITLDEGKENPDNPKNTPGVVNKHLSESVLAGSSDVDTDIKDLKTRASLDGGYALDVDLDQITDDIIKELNEQRRDFRCLFWCRNYAR